MKGQEDVRILDADPSGRGRLEPILEDSFEGWYLRHSIRTLHEIPKVRVAEAGGEASGLAMLKSIGGNAGYVYYIAVAKAKRRMGIGGRLLDDALEYFRGLGADVVYASVENDGAAALFHSRGFRKTHFGEVSGRYGLIRAVAMYRRMLVVPGEVLVELHLNGQQGATFASRAPERPS